MPHYLTNTALSNEALCVEAAKNSGYDVRFEREPMPAYADKFGGWDDCQEDVYANLRDGLVGRYGCVVSYEGFRDHGPFWDEWDRLKKLSASL